MKKRLSLTILVLLVLFSSPAIAAWYFDAEHVDVDLVIASGVEIQRKASAQLEYVTADVRFIPEDGPAQSVIEISTDPDPASPGTYLFRWDYPEGSELGFSISTKVRTNSIFYNVGRIPFPYSGFPAEISPYLKPAETIDSDHPAVISKASELAAGKTDYYGVVFTMADWTKRNVEYDLSTLNIKASKKASWVLAQKDGVCDEITTLFIALLRSVGIPARFISGVAYTESPDFPKNWGAHGWAEVYFPGVGWVPWDVTYGQYGFVDPTHITLKISVDSAEPDTRYEWLGRGVTITADPITADADLKGHTGKIPEFIEVDVDMMQEVVGPGSYNVVEATLKNNKDSYVSTQLYLAKVNELEVVGDMPQAVMLRPLETRKVYWLVRVIDALDTHYTYTFPMTVATMRNTSADSEFYVVPGATVFSKAELEPVVAAAVKEEQKIYSKKIGINCSQEMPYYYVYDDPEIECIARNTGNFPFKDLRFCFREECSTSDLAISQEKSFRYTVHSPKKGINKIPFTVDGKDVSRSFFYDLDVYDEPDISIDDIEYPAEIEFKQPYTVAFTLKKESLSAPQDGKILFDAAGLEKEVEFKFLEGDKKFLFNLNSEDLSTKPNRFTIAVTFNDLNNRTYTEKEEFEISLVNVTFSQRVVIFMYDIDRWLRNLFK